MAAATPVRQFFAMEPLAWTGVFLLAAALLVPDARAADDTPEYILPCRRKDPDINSCVKRAFNHLQPYLQAGIPEIDVPSIDPLVMPRLSMENGNGAVRVRAVFSNTTTRGGSNYTITGVKADVQNYRIDMGLRIPRLESAGDYEVTGNVLLFPVRSQGDFWAVFHDIEAVVKVRGKEVEIGGRRYMKVEKLLSDFSVGRSRFKVRDLLNHNNVLSQAMNHFLNQNANVIIEEMKPAASQSIGNHFKAFMNSAFLKVPIDVWLHDA